MKQVEKSLEILLETGTWAATSIITIGVLFSYTAVTQAGIGMFILIPVGRVIGLLMNYLKEKDYKMVSIAFIVLAVIILSFVIGILSNGKPGH